MDTLARQQAGHVPVPPEHSHGAAFGHEAEAQVYQCPMHPWIKSDKPGTAAPSAAWTWSLPAGGAGCRAEVDPNSSP